jgi:hypothetical protein
MLIRIKYELDAIHFIINKNLQNYYEFLLFIIHLKILEIFNLKNSFHNLRKNILLYKIFLLFCIISYFDKFDQIISITFYF